MRVPRVYSPQPLSSGQIISLNEAASHYLSRVLRLQTGRELVIFNGEGGEYRGKIQALGKKQVDVALGEFVAEDRESPLHLELGIGISRGERLDWVLQKATELGVTRITPLFTERTEVKLGSERLDKKMAHWQQILVSACEQCQRNRLPELSAPQSLANWQNQCSAEWRFVLHHRDNQSLAQASAPQSVALLIGPEGGLADEEILAAEGAGFKPLTLGPRVLRTETAPLVAISLVQYLWGDLS